MTANFLQVARMLCRFRNDCRACGSGSLVPVLDFGEQPLANALLREDQLDKNELRLPLKMQRCVDCGLCQLSAVVEPDLLYGAGYAYRSAYAPGWREHCKALAQELAGKSVLDIGCLDGVLLDECAMEGSFVMGCDPSGTSEHPLIPELFTKDTQAGKFDAIVCQNVFGHVDDARGFLEGIKANLKPTGVAIIEAPWCVDLICHRRWDTIYHEHLSYWGIRPLALLADKIGLRLAKWQRFPDLHGGTMRYTLERGLTVTMDGATAEATVNAERGIDEESNHERFRDSVQCEIQWWQDWFEKNDQKVIAGYGASAKSSTFLNAMPQRPPLVGIFDDNPTKWNCYTPGHHYPVLKPTKMTLRDCEILINFAPNWPLEEKARQLGFTGEVKSIWRS